MRDGATLWAAYATSSEQAYLQDTLLARHLAIDFADHSLELTRPFRGLQMWRPLQVLGVNAFRQALDHKLDLARGLAAQLGECPELEVPWPVELSLVACRPGWTPP